MTLAPSRSPLVDKSFYPDGVSSAPGARPSAEAGFTLVEALIAAIVLTIGIVSLAQLQAVTTVMHANARSVSISTQQAQGKIDELVKLNHATAPAVQITPANPDSLTVDVANYFDTPLVGVTRRWRVQAGPVANTRILTVRIVNTQLRGRPIDVTTILRQW